MHSKIFCGDEFHLGAQHKTATRRTCRRKNQCRTNLYLYIGCTSLRLSLPAFSEHHVAHVRFTHIACRIPVKIVSRARPWGVSVLIQRRRLLLCASRLPLHWLETEWLSSFIRTMPCG